MVCTKALRAELPKNGIETKGLMLQLEPGRCLHGNTGIHLTRVRSLKRITTPIRWNQVVVDTTEFWFTGGRYEHHLHDYRFANKTEAPFTGKADIIGRSCYGDRLMPAVPVPDVEVGDILCVCATGAYCHSMSSNYNKQVRPAVWFVRDGKARPVVRRETYEDLLRCDVS